MRNIFSESQLLFPTPFSYLGDFLVKFAESSLFSFGVKDAQTRKILMVNQVWSNKWGLEPHEVKDMTDRDCMTRSKGFINLEEQLKLITESDNEVIQNNCQSTITQTFLIHDGSVRLQQSTKTPIWGNTSRESIGVAVMTYDLTRYANLLYLFDCYKRYYSKSQAVEQCSKYLGLNPYFHESLTCMELSTLLAITHATSRKQAALLLKISAITFNNYFASIKDKLKSNIDLSMIIKSLRDNQQWISERAAF